MGHDNTENKKIKLSEDQYNICFRGQTEPPFSGVYYKHKEDGVYHCVACEQELFDSKTKYDSGSGWPSFYDVMSENKIELVADYSHHMERVEVKCGQCHAHLGHVFEDGPPPTGRRWCINSLALNFKKRSSL